MLIDKNRNINSVLGIAKVRSSTLFVPTHIRTTSMSIRLYQIIRLVLLIFPLIMLSCIGSSPAEDRYKQALALMENNPALSAVLMQSIKNPKQMPHAHYMQYLVDIVRIKAKAGKDFSQDTLIFETLPYFDKGADVHKKAEAHFFAGIVYYKQEHLTKCFEQMLQSQYYGRLSGDAHIASRSLSNIALVYFEEGMTDSAIVYYKQALPYYHESQAKDISLMLRTLNDIGASYLKLENADSADSAIYYLDRGLALADKYNNNEFRYRLTNNLGIAMHKGLNYDKAKSLFNRILEFRGTAQDSTKAYINLCNIFIDTHQVDSMRYYGELLKQYSLLSSHQYVFIMGCNTLAEYSKQIGNYEDAYYYSELERVTRQKRDRAKRGQELLEINNQFLLRQKQNEFDTTNRSIYVNIIIVVLVFAFLITLMGWLLKKHRSRLKDELHAVQKKEVGYTDQIEGIQTLKKIYQEITHELMTIDTQVRTLDGGDHVHGDNPANKQVRELVAELKQKTNKLLINWSKDYLSKQPSGTKLLTLLDDNNALFITLCYHNYSDYAIACITEMDVDDVHLHKLELRNVLEQVKVPFSQIEDLLFARIKPDTHTPLEDL
jgi:tetratricopeptide (TPR) repeat protein